MKFTKITKKQFCDDLTSSSVIFVSGGFTRRSLEELEEQILDICEEIDVDNSEQCVCTMQSNAIVRHLPNGEKSYIYFDGKGETREFYEYGNIRLKWTTYDNSERNNLVIYMCV